MCSNILTKNHRSVAGGFVLPRFQPHIVLSLFLNTITALFNRSRGVDLQGSFTLYIVGTPPKPSPHQTQIVQHVQ